MQLFVECEVVSLGDGGEAHSCGEQESRASFKLPHLVFIPTAWTTSESIHFSLINWRLRHVRGGAVVQPMLFGCDEILNDLTPLLAFSSDLHRIAPTVSSQRHGGTVCKLLEIPS